MPGDRTKSAYRRREINREELRRYLSEQNKIVHIIKGIKQLEDTATPMESDDIKRINSAITHRLSLLRKYLPDEKSVEVKNAEGETFKTDNKWQIEIVEAFDNAEDADTKETETATSTKEV